MNDAEWAAAINATEAARSDYERLTLYGRCSCSATLCAEASARDGERRLDLVCPRCGPAE